LIAAVERKGKKKEAKIGIPGGKGIRQVLVNVVQKEKSPKTEKKRRAAS